MTWRGFLLRVASLPLIFVLASAMSYTLIWGPWNDGRSVMIAFQGAPPDIIEQIEHDLRLDEPLYRGYAYWLGDAVIGDFGRSVFTDRDIRDEAWRRLPPTAQLAGLSLVFAAAFSFALQVLRERAGARRGAVATWAFLAAIPVAVSVPLLLVLPARWWDYSPVGPESPYGYAPFYEDPWHQFRLFIPAAIAVGASCALLLPAKREPHAHDTAWADGVRDAAVAAARAFPLVLVGAIIAEQTFSVDGEARWFYQAVLREDLLVLQTLLTFALFAAFAVSTFVPHRRYLAADPSIAAHGARRLLRAPLVAFAAMLVVVFVALALLAPAIVPESTRDFGASDGGVGPSVAHPFGTDGLGRDMLSRVIDGVRTSAWFAAPAVLALGAGVLVALGLVYAGRGRTTMLNAIGTVSARWETVPLLWPVLAVASINFGGRAIPAAAVALLGFIAGVELIGAFRGSTGVSSGNATPGFVAFASDSARRNWPLVAAQACRIAALAILTEATISFLGFGGYPGDGNLGGDIRASAFLDYPHVFAFPAAALFLMLFALNLLAASLTERGEVGELATQPEAALSDPDPSIPPVDARSCLDRRSRSTC